MNKEEIQNLIKDLVEKITLTDAQVSITENKGTSTWFSVVVNDPHVFIKRDAEGLYALNHLVRRMTEDTDVAREGSISIDINDFQKKKVDSIKAIAHMMGERARYFKSNIEVDPMSPFERRVVHEFFSDAADLQTESMGSGPTRRVVIKYIGEI